MQSKLVVIVLTVSVATTLAAGYDTGVPDYYLPIPSYSKFTRYATYEVLIKDTRPAGLEPQKKFEEFDRLIAASTKCYERELYMEMRKLADPADFKCSWELVNFIFEILTLAKAHSDKPVLANYVSYVKFYGQAKFNECLKHSEMLFDKVYLSYIEKGCLDGFFSKYLGLKLRVQPMNEELYRRARGVCLSDDDLRVKRTLEVAKLYGSKNFEKDANPQGIVRIFVGDMCRIFDKSDLKHALEVVHLGEALGARLPSKFPVKYMKLIEFNRICIAWNRGDKTRPGLEKALEVVAKAAAAQKRWFKLF